MFTDKTSSQPVLSFPSLCLPPGEVTRDNPYEDVKLSPMCLPIARPQVPKVMEDIPFMSPFHSTEVFFISCVWVNQMILLPPLETQVRQGSIVV